MVAVTVHLDRCCGDRVDDLGDRRIGALVRRQLDCVGNAVLGLSLCRSLPRSIRGQLGHGGADISGRTCAHDGQYDPFGQACTASGPNSHARLRPVDPLTIAALLVFAGVVGIYGSVVGAGGGFVLIPGLVLLFDLEGVEAVGTGAVALAAIGIGGARTYDQKGLVDRRGASWSPQARSPQLSSPAVVADRSIVPSSWTSRPAALALAVFVVAMPTTFEEHGEPDLRSLRALPAGGVLVGFVAGRSPSGVGSSPFLPRPSSSSEPPPSCRDHSSHRHAQFIGVIHWSCHRRKRAVVARSRTRRRCRDRLDVRRQPRRPPSAADGTRSRRLRTRDDWRAAPPSLTVSPLRSSVVVDPPRKAAVLDRGEEGVPEWLDAIERGVDLDRPPSFS